MLHGYLKSITQQNLPYLTMKDTTAARTAAAILDFDRRWKTVGLVGTDRKLIEWEQARPAFMRACVRTK